MRRKDREIVDLHKIEQILARARYLHLGMFDDEYPYIVSLHYGYKLDGKKLTFYVHCAKEGHKLDCLQILLANIVRNMQVLCAVAERRFFRILKINVRRFAFL